MEIDTTTEFGGRVQRRLQEEEVIWLTTVDASGTPQPRPVWFWWNGETILLYSEPDAAKVRHIASNPRVAVHFDSDGQGGNIVVFTGEAKIDEDPVPVDQVDAYVEKYQEGFARIGSTPEEMGRDYSVAVRVWPEKVRGH